MCIESLPWTSPKSLISSRHSSVNNWNSWINIMLRYCSFYFTQAKWSGLSKRICVIIYSLILSLVLLLCFIFPSQLLKSHLSTSPCLGRSLHSQINFTIPLLAHDFFISLYKIAIHHTYEVFTASLTLPPHSLLPEPIKLIRGRKLFFYKCPNY